MAKSMENAHTVNAEVARYEVQASAQKTED
jgi:hypothetical protein